ncbi:MAG: rhodanese-like domain-containing protein [Bacteroidota bacterium]|jgi:phage shock protein E
MLNTLKNLLGISTGPTVKELLADEALIIDVRSPGEFAGGHVPGALNIPLDRLVREISRLEDKDQAIVTCCASGMRSASAAAILRSEGFLRVANGGAWRAVLAKKDN